MLFGISSPEQLNALTIASTHAIANTGTTSILIMDNADVVNKKITMRLITINLLDGRRVMSTHVCDITISGLPTVLVGHIVPHLAVASLIGIRPLCKARCTVTFNDDKCDVLYEGKVILWGWKDSTTDLWTLPINPGPMQTAHQRSAPVINCSLHVSDAAIHPGVDLATFTHSVKTRAYGVKFAHQSLGNPKISTLLKAFLKGCPNLSEKLILKYLNPSPVTANSS